MNRLFSKKHKAGFSLIELSLALMIIGLMAGTALDLYRSSSKPKALQVTQANLDTVNKALIKFLTLNNRLPCPAIPGDSLSSPTAGIEKASCATDAIEGSTENCTAGGYCTAVGRNFYPPTPVTSPPTPPIPLGPPDYVLSGSVPYVTLGMAMPESLDGWDRKLKYVVAATLTKRATYNSSIGNIQMLADNGGSAGAPAQVVVLSSGEDGMGAYTIDGGRYAGQAATVCTDATAPTFGRDFENCNEPADVIATYYNKSGRAYAEGATHYDDVVSPVNEIKPTTDAWALDTSATVVTNMNSKSGRRVGIGTASPETQLHVAGNIRATIVKASFFCNIGGSQSVPSVAAGAEGINCVPPDLFGEQSNRAECTGDGVMTGIISANEVCQSKIAPLQIPPASCPPGKVVCGLTPVTKAIICHTPGVPTCPS